MTEKSPPPGKVWVTVEIDQDDYDKTTDVDLWDLDEVAVERGEEPEDPSDKCNRLLEQAETRFRQAVYASRPSGNLADFPHHASAGIEFLAEALKVLREEL